MLQYLLSSSCQAAESLPTLSESLCQECFCCRVISRSHVYTHTQTPTHVKCTLLNPLRFGAYGAKMYVASHCFFSRPIHLSQFQRWSVGLYWSAYATWHKTWHSLWDPGCPLPDCRDRLSRENKGGSSVPFKGGKRFSGLLPREQTSIYCTMLALSKPRQGKRSQRSRNKISLKLSVNKISSRQSRHLDLEGEIRQKPNEAH